MKDLTYSWEYIPKGTESRKWVEVRKGDMVIDVVGDMGTFRVEEISDDGWVWGPDMTKPYYGGGKMNFMNNQVAWKK